MIKPYKNEGIILFYIVSTEGINEGVITGDGDYQLAIKGSR